MEAVRIIERRGKPRIETKVQVRIEDFGGDLLSFSGNLSKSGIFLETTEPLGKIGERLQMEIRLANALDTVRATGRVARIVKPNQLGTAPGIGIQFLRVEARQARTFDRLIDRLLDARGIGCRKYPRVKTQIVVELKTHNDTRKAISDNLSKGGLFLKLPVNGIVLGDTLNIVILHPTAKRKFMIDAEVVHIRKGESTVDKEFVEGVGVQFLELTPTRRNDMSLFLRSILASQRRGTK
ncbi:MAG: PilZ domain-containing protein [Pseudomonadota bacterium]